MTATATMTSPTTDTWAAQFAELKRRYPKVRDAILVALHILTQNPDIAADDAKAQAGLHGVRITAASINAAQRLLSRQDGTPATTTPTVPAAARADAPAAQRTPRRVRAPEAHVDAEALIRQVVGRLQTQSNTEAERLREAMRKAVSLLQAAVG